jgi:excisionase family DNA binding protein
MYLDEQQPGGDQTPVHRKVVAPGAGGGPHVYVEVRARPFTKLADADLVDTADLCRVFGCSARTVYRWVESHGLRSSGKVGREFLFTKGEVVRWRDENRPRQGRPPARRK